MAPPPNTDPGAGRSMQRGSNRRSSTNASEAKAAERQKRLEEAKIIFPPSQWWRGEAIENVQHKMQEWRELRMIEDEEERTKAQEEKKDIVRDAVLGAAHDKYALIYAPVSYQEDKEICKTLVAGNGNGLLYASQQLRDDYDVCLAACEQTGEALRYASSRLQDNKELCLVAVTRVGRALRRCSKKMQDDFDVVMAAVRENGLALRYASERMQANRDIAFEATQNNYAAYAYVQPGKVKKELEDWLEAKWGLPIDRTTEAKPYRDVRGEIKMPPPGKMT